MIVQNYFIIKTAPMNFRVRQMMSYVEGLLFAEGLETDRAHKRRKRWNAGCTRLPPPVTRPLPEHLLGLRQPGRQLPEFMQVWIYARSIVKTCSN